MARQPKAVIQKEAGPVSGSKVYVYSTLANDQRYITWVHGPDIPSEERSIFIKGGTGIANDRLITPIGVMTEISEEDAAHLEKNPVFKIHADNGYVQIHRVKSDAEKVAADMSMDDPSAPLTDSDYQDEKLPQPVGREK